MEYTHPAVPVIFILMRLDWNRWVSIFHMLVESLEMKSLVFGEIDPTPMTVSELIKNLANGDADLFEKVVIPELLTTSVTILITPEPVNVATVPTPDAVLFVVVLVDNPP